jgi:predicted acetyltransferase
MALENKHLARIELQHAQSEDAPILLNLLELYSHDFSEFCRVDIGEDGRFGYRSLPLYLSEPGRHAFLIRSDGRLAGLALVKRGSEFSGNATVWDLAEFFVLRGYRRHGVGTQAAHELWKQFPGSWEVRVMQSNSAARLFWERAISDFTRQPTQSALVQKEVRHWHLFSFESGGRTPPRTSPGIEQ